MQAELDEHLAQEEPLNRKNGSSSKTMKSPVGRFELKTPHDQRWEFQCPLARIVRSTPQHQPLLIAWRHTRQFVGCVSATFNFS